MKNIIRTDAEPDKQQHSHHGLDLKRTNKPAPKYSAEQFCLDSLKLADPLGRTLVIDWVAQKMTGSTLDKGLVKEFYDSALAQLRHDSPTREVTLGFLALARSIFAVDREASHDAMRWAVYVLNKATDARPSSGGPELGGELGTWVRLQGSMLSPEETLDMTEVIGPAFHEMGTRSPGSSRISFRIIRSRAELTGESRRSAGCS